MATNYKAIYGLVKIYHKQWLTEQMEPMEDGDMVSLIGIKHLLNVSRTLFISKLPETHWLGLTTELSDFCPFLNCSRLA